MTNETIEIIKNLMGAPNCYRCKYHINEECEEQCTEASNMAIEALEKQIPKKAELETSEGEYAIFLCPNCKRIFHNHVDEPQYCDKCSQAIDWSEEEEGEPNDIN